MAPPRRVGAEAAAGCRLRGRDRGVRARPQPGRRSQLVAGATFGGLYLLTGGLWAPIAAHVAHNLLVAGSLSPARAEMRPG